MYLNYKQILDIWRYSNVKWLIFGLKIVKCKRKLINMHSFYYIASY